MKSIFTEKKAMLATISGGAGTGKSYLIHKLV